MPGGHALHRFARAEKCADDIRGKHALQPRRVHRLDAHLRFEDAGVVDEPGERPHLAIDRVEEPQHVALDGDVGLHDQRFAAGGTDLGGEARGGIDVLAIVDADRIAA